MRVQVLEHTWEFSNTEGSVEELFRRIEDLLQTDQYYVSLMLIDGIEIFEEYQEYITDRLTETLDINISLVTKQEMINEIVGSTESYLERAIPEIQALVAEFYQGPTSETWDKFSELLEGIQWIHQMIHSMDIVEESSIEWGQFISIAQKLDEVSIQMQEAVEHKDVVQLGDQLNYELLPQLQDLQEKLQQISKVVNKNVN
jgi:hypothetical protein